MSRNLAVVASFLLVSLGLVSSTVAKEYTLESALSRGEVDKVEVSMDVKGNLRFANGEKIDTAVMEFSCKTVYYERAIALSNEPKGHSRSIRAYESLERDMQVGSQKRKSSLRPERYLVGAQIDGQDRTLFSPEGELTREELELLERPIDSLILSRLLPTQPVTLGATWEVPEPTAATLTGLDRVKEGGLICKLIEIDADRALVEMSGELEGAMKGVGATLRVKARFRFDRRLRRVDWLGMVFEENSEVGPVEDGGKAVAKLQVTISPLGQTARAKLPASIREKLSDKALAAMTLHADESATQLTYIPQQGPWHLTHDRRWFEYDNNESRGVLRFLDKGDWIAQCNVTTLETLSRSELPTLEKFQEDIQKAMGDEFGQFTAAKQWANDQDYRVYRVVVEGVVGKDRPEALPMQWQFYQVIDRHGRRVGLTFTVEAGLVERFGDSGQKLVDSLRFSKNLMAAVKKQVKK